MEPRTKSPAGRQKNESNDNSMKKTLAVIIGLALAASALTVSAQQAPGGQGAPGKSSGKPNKECPAYGQGQGQGQQNRYGRGQGMGQQRRNGQGLCDGQGAGRGYRGGACDGTGPRRDGSCGQCPTKP